MIELYTWNTSNGQRASIMLEESGLPYRPHFVDITKGEQQKENFLAINPMGKIPAIVDRASADGQPLVLFETTAILLYLAEKTGRFMPSNPRARADVYAWLAFSASDLTPAFTGQFYFTILAPEKIPYAIDLYTNEISRFLKVMETRLGAMPYLAGDDYSLADIHAYPSAATSAKRLKDGLAPYPNIEAWVKRIGARPAVQRGMAIYRAG